MKALSFALTPINQQDNELLVQLSGIDTRGEAFLNHADRIPHVTLSMGCVNETGEKRLLNAFEPITKMISFSEFSAQDDAQSPIQWLHVNLSEELSVLHRTLDAKMAEVRSKVVHNSAFHLQNELTGREAAYVANFKQHAGQQYKPHVTLGYGVLPNVGLPLTMEMEVGLFQLGPSCTCAKRLC